MMALERERNVCLDVAIDHRIMGLFKPVSTSSTSHSKHVSRIEARGRLLGRSREEVQVTAQLAGPASKGGIAITLQQPRHNHPFEEGLNSVIEDCETLLALKEIFDKVSCNTVDTRTHTSIIDLLPYISEKVAKAEDAELKEAFRVSVQAIRDKQPDVLLCAGKIWLDQNRFREVKGNFRGFESIGIGQKFAPSPGLSVITRIYQEDDRLVSIKRVNGFHPSYAMNYHPHASIFRQLLILIGAEVCGVLINDWKDKEWMDELRRHCQELSVSLSDKTANKYLKDYGKLYSDALHSLYSFVDCFIINSRTSKKSLYGTLLQSKLSEYCNDATLILRQMSRLQREKWPDFAILGNKAALDNAAAESLQVTKEILELTEGEDTQLIKIIRPGIKLIRQSVKRRNRFSVYELNLDRASKAFLKLAIDIETALSTLLLNTDEAFSVLEHDDLLSNMMEQVKLEPQFSK